MRTLAAALLGLAILGARAPGGEPGLAEMELEADARLDELFQRTVALAQLHDVSGDIERAASLYEAARRIQDTDTFVLTQLTRLYREGRDDAKLLSVYAALAKLQPTSVSWLRKLGSCYFRVGKREEAEATWQRILDVHPQRASALRYLAPVYLQHGLHQKAISAYREALDASPRDDYVRLRLAETLQSVGDHLEALVLLTALGETKSTYHARRAAEARKRAMAALATSLGARAALARHLGSGPCSAADLGWALARVYEQEGDRRRAAAFYRRVAEIEPDSDRGRTAVARARALDPTGGR